MPRNFERLLLAGFLLIASSFAAPLVIGQRQQWTDSMAVKFQAASHNYHAAIHSAAHAGSGESNSSPKLDDARREYEKYDAMLQAAQNRGANVARLLRWIGSVAFGCGLAVYFATQLGLVGKESGGTA